MTTRRLLQFPGIHQSTMSVVVLGVLFSIFLTFPTLATAQSSGDPVAQCNPSFTACAIPEDVQLTFPPGFLAISGDVVLAPSLHSDLSAVSDVFHLDNNLLNTGLGTGLGNAAFLFSGHNNTLPNPSTYSANAVEIRETPEGHGPTDYFGNGTDYFLDTGVTPLVRGGSKA